MSDQAEVFALSNVHLGDKDFLYHIDLTHENDLLKTRFQDVKYVCMGGKPTRMRDFARYMYEKLGKPVNSELDGTGAVKDISAGGGRYSMFKVGPLLSVSHGIGTPSLSVVLHEVFKLLHYAKCGSDVEFFRIGTSGGMGLDPGTIVITEKSYDGLLNHEFFQAHCGKSVHLPAPTDTGVRENLLVAAKKSNIPALVGNTMSTDDFFEGQARTDGAFCNYQEADKTAFLKRAHNDFGVKNIEMESLCFAAMCHRAGVKCAVACVTVVNRLERDDVTADGDLLEAWQKNLYVLMESYINARSQ